MDFRAHPLPWHLPRPRCQDAAVSLVGHELHLHEEGLLRQALGADDVDPTMEASMSRKKNGLMMLVRCESRTKSVIHVLIHASMICNVYMYMYIVCVLKNMFVHVSRFISPYLL